MTSYTLPLIEAENQLRKLVERTQHTHQPIVLTGEASSEPVAILLDPSIFELLQRHERQLFYLRLQELNRYLKQIEQIVASQQSIHQQDIHPLIEEFQRATRNLWSVCPKAQHDLCATFIMASRRLSPDAMLLEQIAVLRTGIELLHDEMPNTVEATNYHQQLFDCGLPPTLIGDHKLSDMYLDAL